MAALFSVRGTRIEEGSFLLTAGVMNYSAIKDDATVASVCAQRVVVVRWTTPIFTALCTHLRHGGEEETGPFQLTLFQIKDKGG